MKGMFKRLTLLAATIATGALLLSGCSGSDGSDGANGANGADGKDAGAVVKVSDLTSEQWSALSLKGEVTGVTIASAPVVSFKVTDANGKPVVGLGVTSKNATTALVASTPNFSFNLAKLVPGANGGPSKWVSYIVTTVPNVAVPDSIPCQPTTDNAGTIVDNGDGSYTYTFYRDIAKIKDQVAAATVVAPKVLADLGDLTYDPTLTHRLAIRITGNKPGTGTNTPDAVQVTPGVALATSPLPIIYDFVPLTGKAVAATDTNRNITENAKCMACHTEAVPGHRGSDTRNCVLCHNDQLKFGRAAVTSVLATATNAATGVVANTMAVAGTAAGAPRGYVIDGETLADYPIMIHKIHMGNSLKKTGFGYNIVGFNMKAVVYPQSKLNCTKCHTNSAAAPQGDNWKTVPTRLACGACHDGINWATGGGITLGKVKSLGTTFAGHMGGAATDDSKCAGCHPDSSIYHITANSTPLNPTVPKDAAGKDASVFTYDIKTVTANASNQPIVTFRILEKKGTAAAAPITLRSYTGTAGAPGVDADGTAAYYANVDGNSGLYAGFTGNPSFQLHFSTTGGVDFDNQGSNSIRNYPGQPALSVFLADLMTGTGGTIDSGPDADGYYVATLKSANAHSSSVTATNAGTYTNPDGTAGAASPAVTADTNFANLGKITTTIPVSFPADSKMRAVQMLGNFTQVNLDKPYVYTKAVSGTGASGGLGRGVPTVVKYVTSDTARRNVVTMAKCQVCHEEGLGHQTPLNMANCVTCHNPMLGANVSTAALASAGWGFKPLIHTAHEELASGIAQLNKCEICHIAGTYSSVPAGALPSTTIATYVRTTADSTILPGIRVSTGVTVNLPTDLVTSPYTSACISCHTSDAAKNHASLSGGYVDGPRSGYTNTESCATCHGAGKAFDVIESHK